MKDVLLNVLWDYRNGYYVSERAPARYRARRFLEKRAIPALGAAAAAAKPRFTAAAKFALALAVWALYQLCRGLAWAGWRAGTALSTGRLYREAESFYRSAKPRGFWESALVGAATVAAFAPVFLAALFLALAGAGAEILERKLAA